MISIVRDAVSNQQPIDLHLHTRSSIDVTDGNSFEEFMIAGERIGIVPGFLDHFQSEYLDNPKYPFHDDNIGAYVDEFRQAGESGYKAFLGLEVDYYSNDVHPDRNARTAEWLDCHKDDFDYFVGTIHDVFDTKITIMPDLKRLLKRHSFQEIQDHYYQTLDDGIISGLFNGFAHPDVVYRFCGNGGVLPLEEEYSTDFRTLAALESCVSRDIVIELNLRGFDHPWHDTYPAEALFRKIKNDSPGAMFFTGSDSHDVTTFDRSAPITKKYFQVLNG
ncbi:MAG TPA: hypothetical protein VKM55_11910 [Candidatus Lokiarchaeia archaeon]|nr:hypothetical protein [Candidatus Lokiarchaeia archaeon]